MHYQFPKNFLWGASTSAHQVEGNSQTALIELLEKQGLRVRMEDMHMDVINDWTEWERKNASRLAKEARSHFGHLPNWQDIETEATNPENYISGIACDHYNRYKEDFALAKELGHNATRLSIEWARIEPTEETFDEKVIAHYQDVIKSCRDNGLEPFVTLWHWPVPLWLCDKGGVLASDFTKYFIRYAEKMARELPEVKFWITLNEPEIYGSHSYYKGVWPPQKKGVFNFFRVMDKLSKSHIAAYSAIKKIDPAAQIGVAKNNIWFEATGPLSKALKYLCDWFWNHLFLINIVNHQDFIGLNHYFHRKLLGKNENKKISDMGWELYPGAIYHCLTDLKKYGKPIYITENGLADAKDEKREWFIKESLKNVHRAISEGADVRGYLHWSLLDNFEWDKGFWPRFGLIEIDYKTLARIPRQSAYAYKKIIENNGIAE